MSRSARGNYYKAKTKKYLEAKGYYVDYCEIYKTFWNPRLNKIGYAKRDLFASDLIAMNGKQILFVNSIFNKTIQSKNVAEHKKRFDQFPFPECDCIKKMIIIWKTKIRDPIILELD